jgi:hypothetical protein
MSTLTAQLNGSIPVGVKYTTVGVRYNRKRKNDDNINFDLSQCENCGRIITNVFKIQNADDKTAKVYSVGSECVVALCGESYKLSEEARQAKIQMKIVKWFWENPGFYSIENDRGCVWVYEKRTPDGTWKVNWKWRMRKQFFTDCTGRTTADFNDMN